jgi:dTDP-4-amino-4,6-dideoxygalactose transaminase
VIPRLHPHLGAAELAALLRPDKPGTVAEFERAFAAHMGQRHAIAFPYGRTGLALLLEALGLHDAEVICPAYTCVVVPHAVVFSGNVPVFIDSARDGWNMDLALAEAHIGPRTRALIATSLFGSPVDLDALAEIARRHPQLHIIQDCAHSFAAEWHGRPVQRAGVAAVFGMNASKLLCSIFGGMISTDDDQLAQRLRARHAARLGPPDWRRSLRRRLYALALYPAFWAPAYGVVNRLERSGLLDRFVRYYNEAAIDMPADWLTGMSAVEAGVGLVQLARHRQNIERRRRNARFYLEHLPQLPDTICPPWIDGSTYSHFVVFNAQREKIMRAGLQRGVQFGRIVEYNCARLPAYRDAKFIDRGVADRLAASALNLPVHCQRESELAKVVEVLAELVGSV